MFRETYTKLYAIMGAAFLLGFLSMEAITLGLVDGGITGHAVSTVSGAESLTGAFPGGGLVLFGIGLLAGGLLAGIGIYVYSYEKRD